MLNSTRTLLPEIIDESKPYKHIHAETYTIMQLTIKMLTETIVTS